MFYAANTNDVALLTRALSAGAVINHFDTVTAQPRVASTGQSNINPIDMEWAGTAISVAACRGNTDVIEYLLQRGADLDAGPISEHPIVTAVGGSQTDSIHLLLAHVMDLVRIRNSAVDLMWHATQKGSHEMVELLLDAYEVLGMGEVVLDDLEILYNTVVCRKLGVTHLQLERYDYSM